MLKLIFLKLMKISLLLTGKKPEEFTDAEMLALEITHGGLEHGCHFCWDLSGGLPNLS